MRQTMNISRYHKKRALRLMRFVQKWRIYFFHLISTNQPKVFSDCIYHQPVQFVGDGLISLDNVSFGVFPSPNFLVSYAYIETRGVNDQISIGSGTIF